MFTPLILPNGSRLPNRLAKAALEENLADEGQLPGPALWRLYRHWGIGGAGLIITGNVMIDGRAMTGPGGVVLEQDTPLEAFKTWAAASRQEGAQVWMQLSHPGRQVMANMGGNAWAPSAIPMAMGKYSKAFAQPEAMSETQIAEVIARFAASAHAAEKAGFTGVQIHAAHGYLISQFLSPLANQRSDRWGRTGESRPSAAGGGARGAPACLARLLRGGEAQFSRFSARRLFAGRGPTGVVDAQRTAGRSGGVVGREL